MKKILFISYILLLFMSCGNNTERARNHTHLKDSIAHYREKGKELRNSSKFVEAIDTHKHGLALAEQAHDTLEIVQALNNIGTDYRRMGILDEASLFHYRALNLNSQYSDKESKTTKKNEVVSLNGIGNILITMGDFNLADSIFRRALVGEEAIGSIVGMAINYANIGSIFSNTNRSDSALHYYQLSMEANKKAGSKLGISICHTHIGEIYEKNKDTRKAINEYQEAYKLMKGEGDRWHALESCIALANLYIKNNMTSKAATYIEEARLTAEQINSKEHLAKVYHLSYKMSQNKADYANALKYLEKSNEYSDSVLNEKNQKHLQNLMVQYERQSKKYEIDRLENELNTEKLNYTFMAFAAMVVVSILLTVLVLTLNKARRQQKRAKEDITKAYEETKRALEVKTSFMKSIKHEIRTPLNGIMGFSQVMASLVSDNEQLKQTSDIIEMQCTQLTKIIDTILDYADIDSLMPKSTDVNIDTIVHEVLANIANTKEPNVEVHYNTSQKGFIMKTDKDLLSKALYLILDNAAKFTKKGHIDVNTAYDYGIMTVTISDTGCGVPAEKTEWVFEQFTKIDEFIPGMGMGLTLCRAIVTRLEGLVYIDKEYIGGCKVVIKLPIKQYA